MVGAVEVAALRSAQASVVVRVERDLAAFLRGLNLAKPEVVRNALLEYVPLLVSQYGDQAAVIAAEWYDEARAAEGVRGRFRSRPAALVSDDRVLGKVRSAAAHLWTTSPELILPALMDPLSKYVLEPARMTIVDSTNRDPQTSGWQRVTRAGSCGFCRMLADRGGVYKEATAGFGAHGHCNCAAAPSWDPDAPEVGVRAYRASQRLDGLRRRAAAGEQGAVEQLAAHNARVRGWVAQNLD